jgi:hypothetical protein
MVKMKYNSHPPTALGAAGLEIALASESLIAETGSTYFLVNAQGISHGEPSSYMF